MLHVDVACLKCEGAGVGVNVAYAGPDNPSMVTIPARKVTPAPIRVLSLVV